MSGSTPGLRRLLLFTALGISAASLGAVLLEAIAAPSALSIFASEICVFFLAGIIVYLRTEARFSGDTTDGAGTEPALSTILILKTAYVLAFAAAVISLHLSLYVPIIPYYVAILCAVGALGLEIVIRETFNRLTERTLLLELIVIGVVVQESFAWLNPQSVYSDMAFHWLGVSAIAETGRIPPALGYYAFFPAFHVLNAILVELGLLGLANYTVVNHLLMITAIPSSYLLGKELVSKKIAMVGALLVVMSIFFFLWVVVLPSLLGASVMVTACYALLRYHKTRTVAWRVTFWILALFVFFSHPINALVMGIVLVVYWVNSWIGTPRASAFRSVPGPTATYLVMYVSYLAFMAVTTFVAFVDSIFASGPRIEYARVYQGAVPPAFIIQSIMSTLGFAVLFLPGTVGILGWLFSGVFSRRLLVGVLGVLTITAGISVLSGRGSYGFQAARSLLYLSIFMCVPASYGLLRLAGRIHGRRAQMAVLVASLVFICAVSTTSYLTGNGNRIITDTIPVQTSYATDSMLASRWFLQTIPDTEPLSLDRVLSDYLAPAWSGLGYPYTIYPINHTNLVEILPGGTNDSVSVAVSEISISNSGFLAANEPVFEQSLRNKAYDNGVVRVYIAIVPSSQF